MCNVAVAEKKKFEFLVEDFISYLEGRTKAIIEFYACMLAYDEQPIYDVSHKNDPPYDSSGDIILTDEYFTKDSKYTLRQIMDMYTGESYPSYQSGCGLFYEIHEEKCQEMIEHFLYDFCVQLINKCIKYDMFTDYFSKHFDPDISLQENILDFSPEFCNEYLFPYKLRNEYIFYVEDKCKKKFGNQLLSTIYSKYIFFLRQYQKKYEAYKEHNDAVYARYSKLANLIEVPQKFETIIEEKTDLYKQLRMEYTNEELAILFKFKKLKASNSITQRYLNSFNTISKERLIDAPDAYEFLYQDIDDVINKRLKIH